MLGLKLLLLVYIMDDVQSFVEKIIHLSQLLFEPYHKISLTNDWKWQETIIDNAFKEVRYG